MNDHFWMKISQWICIDNVLTAWKAGEASNTLAIFANGALLVRCTSGMFFVAGAD